MVYTTVKPLCLFEDLSKPSGLLPNKMMTFAIGLTVKTWENKPNHSEHIPWTSLTDELAFVNSFHSSAT